MPLATSLPYGLRDVKITPYTDASATTLAAVTVDLPYSRTFKFTDAEEFQELRGDDQVVTTRGQGPGVEWELENGGLSFEAVKAMYGGTITESGVTPNLKKSYIKKSTDSRPFFKVEGQSISDSGGDVHSVLDRCRATGDLEGEFGDGQFFITGSKGVALPSRIAARTDMVYEFVHNETVTNIT